jgi:hypothetical protein
MLTTKKIKSLFFFKEKCLRLKTEITLRGDSSPLKKEWTFY